LFICCNLSELANKLSHGRGLYRTVTRQFTERQFIERQFIEPTVHRTTVYRTTIYRTTVYRTDSLSTLIKPSTRDLNAHIQWNNFYISKAFYHRDTQGVSNAHVNHIHSGTPDERKGRGAVVELLAMETYIKKNSLPIKKFVTNCFCFATMLTLNITEIIENPSNFLGARIAAISLFQFGINKPWNYL